MRRLIAAGVALALVITALIIRSRHDAVERLPPYRLTCATELADVCNSLHNPKVAVTVEPAGATADRLVGLAAAADPGFDGWLAAGRWSEMVAEARKNAGQAAATNQSTTLGGAKVAVAIWHDRANALRTACGGTLSWKCIGDSAARGARYALPDPFTESAGLAGLAAATAGYKNSTAFVPGDLSQDDAFLHWLTAFAHAVPQPSPGLTTMLTQGRAAADAYIGLDAEITPVLRTAATQDKPEVVYLAPVIAVDVVLARAAVSTRRAPDGLTAALADWTTKRTDPNPTAIALAGLRALWKDIPR